MSISDSVSRTRKGLLLMTGVTLFCLLFSIIYNYYGRGVYSDYMTRLFLIPLVAGVMPYGIGIIVIKREVPRFAYNCYNSGIITLIVGSMLKGIFEIAGTNSPYLILYGVVGAGMIFTGGVSCFLLQPKQAQQDQ